MAAMMIFSSAYVTTAFPGSACIVANAASVVHISNCKIKLSSTSVTYNGKAQKPKVTVTYSKRTLK